MISHQGPLQSDSTVGSMCDFSSKGFDELYENPFIIQDIILEEKRHVNSYGPTSLNIDLNAKSGKALYKAIDFVRFHRIVAARKVSVQLVNTANEDLVVLVIDPSVAHQFKIGVDIEHCPGAHSLADSLLNPLDSTDCLVRYAVLSHRDHLCWEFVGVLGPLDDDEATSEEAVEAVNATEQNPKRHCQPEDASNVQSREDSSAEPSEVVTHSLPYRRSLICPFCYRKNRDGRSSSVAITMSSEVLAHSPAGQRTYSSRQ